MTTTLRVGPPPDWMARAACLGMTHLFFGPDEPAGHRPDDRVRVARARAVCDGCPVWSPCRAFALSQPNTLAGVWAGTTQRQRAGIRRQIFALFDDRSYDALVDAFRIMRISGAQAVEGFEGVVWHHPDGRMAKLKVRDLRELADGVDALTQETT